MINMSQFMQHAGDEWVTAEMEPGQDFWPVTWPDPVAFDPVTRPDPVIDRCETNPRQQLDSSISYLAENQNRLVA